MAGENVVKRVSTIFTLKDDEFNRSLGNVNKQLKLTQSEMKLAGEKLKAYGNDTKALGDKQKALEQQIKNVNDKIKLHSQNIVKNTEAMNKNKTELDALKNKKTELNAKYKEAVKLYGEESKEAKELKAELDNTTQAYKKKEQQVKNNINALNKSNVEINKSEAELVGLQNELNKTSESIKRNSSNFILLGENLEKTSERMKLAGSKISEFGGFLQKLGTPLVGFGALASKMSIDFEKGLMKINTIANVSQGELDKLKGEIIDLSNETGVSVGEIAESFYQAMSAGQSYESALGFVTTANKLAKAGFLDLNGSVDILSTVLNGYGMEANEVARVSDILVKTQEKGKLTIGELNGILGKLIPTANNSSVSLENIGTAMAVATSQGIPAAESVTYISQMLTELNKSGSIVAKTLKSETGKSFKELMEEGKDLEDILSVLKGSADKQGKSFNDMWGSAEACKVALALLKDEGKAFDSVLKEMSDSAGTTNKAFEKMDNTTGQKLAKSWNELKNSLLKLGDALAPTIEILANGLSKVADSLSEMDANTLASIVKLGGLSVAFGTAAKGIGGFISGVGSIVGVAGKMANALGITSTATATVGTSAAVAGGASGLGALVGGLGTAVAAVAPWVLGAGAIAAAGYGIHKTMSQEVVPSVNLFSDSLQVTGKRMTEHGEILETQTIKISEETAKQVQAYLDLDEGVKNALNGLYINSDIITQETCTNMLTQYQQLGDNINAAIEQDKQEDLQTLGKFFEDSAVMSQEAEINFLNIMQQGHEAKKEEVNRANEEIKQIMTTASEENRALKQEEVNRITELQNQMREQAVISLSTQEQEANVILDRLAAYDKRVTADMASEHIKTLNNQRDKAIDSANTEYRETVSTLERMRDDLGIITSEQADKLIKEAERQRDGTINAAKKTRDEAVNKIFEMNTELQNNVDTTTGKIVSFWDKMFGKWDRWQPSKKTLHYEYKVSGKPPTSNGETIVGYATGTQNAKGGLAYVNEKGWELFDIPKTRANEMMNLPAGTRVTNHIQSTAKMKRDVEKEVSSQLSVVLNSFVDSLSSLNTDTKNTTDTKTAVFHNVFNIKTENDNKNIGKDVAKILFNQARQQGYNKTISR